MEEAIISLFLKNTKKHLFLAAGILVLWASLLGCGQSEEEIIVVASALRLDTTAGLPYDQMVLEISFEPNLKIDSSKKDKGSNDKDFLLQRTEDVKILPESEINLNYLNLDRFEDSLAYKNKAELDARPNIGIAERLRVADKKLIFGGKGFDTRDFEELNDGKLSGDFSTYINPPREKSANLGAKGITNMNQKLRPEEKSLIFHGAFSALTETEIEISLNNEENQKKKKSVRNNFQETKKIPETLVHLKKSPEGLIQLRPTSSSLDLLRENPSIIKDRFSKTP